MRELKNRGDHTPGAWLAVASPGLFWIVVAGGDGRHSTWLPAWNVCRGASEVVAAL